VLLAASRGGAKKVGYVGLALTVVVSLACTMTPNWREQTTPTSPGLLVLMGVVIALPMLVAGRVIVLRRG
jgi:prolipoprotein diacylglyceryltransferase